MSQTDWNGAVADLKQQLEIHPVYQSVETLDDLRCFMEHHVYSVWDFMSLVKLVQSVVAPAGSPWLPNGDAQTRRFINELVLEEESDVSNIEGEYLSHFELYQRAMAEIGADEKSSVAFVEQVREQGAESALSTAGMPEPSRTFTTGTFSLIDSNRPHMAAASLALGREHVIPAMFRQILAKAGVYEADAPTFHFYLNRHVELDEGSHGPMSLQLLDELCGGDDAKRREALEAARKALTARIALWDDVLEAINSRSSSGVQALPVQLTDNQSSELAEMSSQEMFDKAVSLIDAANSEDPNKVEVDGKEWPKELLYSHRMAEMIDRFAPDANDIAKLAVRAQHIQRWKSPRDEYPMNRQGYLKWRTNLYKFHAETTGELLKQAGYDDEFIEEVKKAVGKRALKVNANTQLLEDVTDLVFIEHYMLEFAQKHPEYSEEKWIDIIQKTWKKMSGTAHEFALSGNIILPEQLVPLIQKALA
jgi:hypothetical protein